MMRVISSPSSSTTGFATLMLSMEEFSVILICVPIARTLSLVKSSAGITVRLQLFFSHITGGGNCSAHRVDDPDSVACSGGPGGGSQWFLVRQGGSRGRDGEAQRARSPHCARRLPI